MYINGVNRRVAINRVRDLWSLSIMIFTLNCIFWDDCFYRTSFGEPHMASLASVIRDLDRDTTKETGKMLF